MKKLITFSLWGDNPKYWSGAFANIKLVPKIYPGWTARFYIPRGSCGKCNSGLTHEFTKWNHDSEFVATNSKVELVFVDEPGDWRGMFWRFRPASEDDVDVFISRDCDSRLSQREADAVQEWLDSPYLIHTIRDHPEHTAPLMGGLWGAKQHAIPDMKELIEKWNKEDRWQTDQEFLRDVIWPRYGHKILAHDNWGRFNGAIHHRPFPTGRDGDNFVGAIIGSNEQRLHPEHHAAI